MLIKETAFWPIRTQCSVWDNHCKKSIYEPELLYIFNKKKKKVGSLLPFTHPFISYRNYFAWYTVGTSVSPAAGITRVTEKDVESALVNKDPCQLSPSSRTSQHRETPIRRKQYCLYCNMSGKKNVRTGIYSPLCQICIKKTPKGFLKGAL